jgi:hypothetical protein
MYSLKAPDNYSNAPSLVSIFAAAFFRMSQLKKAIIKCSFQKYTSLFTSFLPKNEVTVIIKLFKKKNYEK